MKHGLAILGIDDFASAGTKPFGAQITKIAPWTSRQTDHLQSTINGQIHRDEGILYLPEADQHMIYLRMQLCW